MDHSAIVDTGLDEKNCSPGRVSPILQDDTEARIAQLPKLESSPVSVSVPEPTSRIKYDAVFQFITLCFSMFLPGFNDGTLGPLLPRIQAVYHVSPCSFKSLSVQLTRHQPRRSGIPLYPLYS